MPLVINLNFDYAIANKQLTNWCNLRLLAKASEEKQMAWLQA